MLILHNIDPKLLAELLVEAASLARSKTMSGQREAPRDAGEGAGPGPSGPANPALTGGGEEAGHVRPAR